MANLVNFNKRWRQLTKEGQKAGKKVEKEEKKFEKLRDKTKKEVIEEMLNIDKYFKDTLFKKIELYISDQFDTS